MKIVAKVPGKLILLGEYAVLEGGSSLVMTVDRFARVEISFSDQMTFTLQAPSIGIRNLQFSLDKRGKIQFLSELSPRVEKKLKFFISIFEFGFRLLKKSAKTLPHSEILLDTDAFFHKNRSIKLGLGSSAALTVALVAGLIAGSGQSVIENDQLFRAAMQAHRAAQGNVGSGIDIAASIFGGILSYQIDPHAENLNPQIKQLKMPSNLFMVPVWVGKCSSTSQFVKLFYDFKNKDKRKFAKLVTEMKFVADAGKQAFRKQDISGFLDSINQYNLLMKKLGEDINAPIVSEEHLRMANLASEIGVAYKPSGAGGGDIGLCFADSEEKFSDLKKASKAAGFEPLDLNFESSGIHIKSIKVEASENVAYS
ncbi:hypothetical protein B6D60_00100 [candidate division KSB1 bacterium 4484_87]|nr:MAG: hypothetical protein B6D60_00100 [candidate division KSB1 bacterium 4484_87]